MRRLVSSLATIVFLIIPISTYAEDVENPQFSNWSKFPVGTEVTSKATVVQNDKTTTTITLVKLVSKSENNLLISSVISSDGTGKLITNDPIEKTINRNFPLLPGVDKTKIGRPQGSQASGMESIELLGKKYNAEWYDTKSQTEAGPSLTRTWISMDVPNMLLKSVTEVKAANKKVNIEITEIKIP